VASFRQARPTGLTWDDHPRPRAGASGPDKGLPLPLPGPAWAGGAPPPDRGCSSAGRESHTMSNIGSTCPQ